MMGAVYSFRDLYGPLGMWESLVIRRLGEPENVGSNPTILTCFYGPAVEADRDVLLGEQSVSKADVHGSTPCVPVERVRGRAAQAPTCRVG
jgi:hypothetical protein